MNTLNTGKNVFFEVTSQKHCKLMYINDNQTYSDNKYLNKRHNIIKSLSGTLNFNKSTENKKCDEQEVTLPGL